MAKNGNGPSGDADTTSLEVGIRPLEVKADEGFANDKDIFEYEPLGKSLSNLVGKASGPLVLVLDGPWGSGKTTFARQWAGVLGAKGHPVIFFDAFVHDGEGDVFFALAGEILQYGRDFQKIAFIEAFKKAAAGLATAIVSASFTSVTGLPALHLLVPTKSSTLLRRRIEAVKERREASEEFKEALSKLCRSLGRGQGDNAGRRLVFVVDELDRCRPTFALNLLERVKHVFDVDEVCFVLVADLRALEQMVQRSYGIGDAHTYLKKFFHLRVDLTAAADVTPEIQRERYLNRMVKARRVESWKPGDPQGKIDLDILLRLANFHEVSLRDVEELTLCTYFAQIAMDGRWGHGAITAGLVFMKVLDPERFEEARRGRLTFSQADEFLGFRRWPAGSRASHEKARWAWKWITKEAPSDEEERAYWKALDGGLGAYNLEAPADALAHACRCIDSLSVN